MLSAVPNPAGESDDQGHRWCSQRCYVAWHQRDMPARLKEWELGDPFAPTREPKRESARVACEPDEISEETIGDWIARFQQSRTGRRKAMGCGEFAELEAVQRARWRHAVESIPAPPPPPLIDRMSRGCLTRTTPV